MPKQIQKHCTSCNNLFYPKKGATLCKQCTPILRDYEAEAIVNQLKEVIYSNQPFRLHRWSEVW